jgi:hypothetical protein
MAAKQCKSCKKFQKKHVELDERGFCPDCAAANPIVAAATEIERGELTPDQIALIGTPGEEASPEPVDTKVYTAEEIAGMEVEAPVVGELAPVETYTSNFESGEGEVHAPVSEAVSEAAIDGKALVTGGKRGVTNAQMIPVMRKYLDENNVPALEALKAAFPQVFESSRKYIGHKRKENLDKVIPA